MRRWNRPTLMAGYCNETCTLPQLLVKFASKFGLKFALKFASKIEPMKLACTSLVAVLLVSCGLAAQSPTTDISSSSAVGHPAKAVVAGFAIKEPGSEGGEKALIAANAGGQGGVGTDPALTRNARSLRIRHDAQRRSRIVVA